MKSRSKIITVICVLILFLLTFLVVHRMVENKRIPYIAFMQVFDSETCFYICSDGKIYASTSEESFLLTSKELIERVQKEDYSGMLEPVGQTSGTKVRKMHRLFSKVVLKGDYHLSHKYTTVINNADGQGELSREGYEDKVWYWFGLYYNGEAVESNCFYQSLSDMECSDKRAYNIVEWMYDTLREVIY